MSDLKRIEKEEVLEELIKNASFFKPGPNNPIAIIADGRVVVMDENKEVVYRRETMEPHQGEGIEYDLLTLLHIGMLAQADYHKKNNKK